MRFPFAMLTSIIRSGVDHIMQQDNMGGCRWRCEQWKRGDDE